VHHMAVVKSAAKPLPLGQTAVHHHDPTSGGQMLRAALDAAASRLAERWASGASLDFLDASGSVRWVRGSEECDEVVRWVLAGLGDEGTFDDKKADMALKRTVKAFRGGKLGRFSLDRDFSKFMPPK
jgi:hypothetical protein